MDQSEAQETFDILESEEWCNQFLLQDVFVDQTPEELQDPLPTFFKVQELKPILVKPITSVSKPKKVAKPQKIYNISFDQIRLGEKPVKKKQEISRECINLGLFFCFLTIFFFEGPWSFDEIEQFEKGYLALGKRWKKISLNFIRTRNTVQVASFGQKYVKNLESQ